MNSWNGSEFMVCLQALMPEKLGEGDTLLVHGPGTWKLLFLVEHRDIASWVSVNLVMSLLVNPLPNRLSDNSLEQVT